MTDIVWTTYRFFEPEKTLDDLRGDMEGLRTLAKTFLGDLKTHLNAIVDDPVIAPDAAHRLRTACGIFHAPRGLRLCADIERTYKSGKVPDKDIRLALMSELMGLCGELQRFLEESNVAVMPPPIVPPRANGRSEHRP